MILNVQKLFMNLSIVKIYECNFIWRFRFFRLRLKNFLITKKYNVLSAGRSHKNEIQIDILDPKLKS